MRYSSLNLSVDPSLCGENMEKGRGGDRDPLCCFKGPGVASLDSLIQSVPKLMGGGREGEGERERLVFLWGLQSEAEAAAPYLGNLSLLKNFLDSGCLPSLVLYYFFLSSFSFYNSH